MYNRILKRPMFRRGGPSFQAQGTGITSPYDTPQTIGGGVIHGNPMGNRIGFEDPYIEDKKRIELLNKENIAEAEQIGIEREELFETPKGTWLDDVIGSFGAYSTPYKESGEAKTIGEMGAEQAEAITAIRKERKEKQGSSCADCAGVPNGDSYEDECNACDNDPSQRPQSSC